MGKQNLKDYIYHNDISLIMGKKAYSQAFSDNAHNIKCKKRFVCRSFRCPDEEKLSKFSDHSTFPCFIEKFDQNQPKGKSFDFYKNEWEEANKITWGKVLYFEDRWLSILFYIFISLVFTEILIFLQSSLK